MFDKEKYGKILVPMVTPFQEDQGVDYESAVQIAERLIRDKLADTLIISGTTGEFFSLKFEERIKLFRTIKEAVGSKIPLIAGTACISTIETIQLTKAVEEMGYETVMIASPYYTKPNQLELYHHFKKIAESTKINITLYNIPIFTGVNLNPGTVSRLSEIDNIVAIKEEAELNPKQITEYINVTPKDFLIYCGDDSMIIESLAQGGKERIGGVISGGSHIIGKQMRKMIDTFIEGNVSKAARMQQELLPLFRSFGQNNRFNPVALLKAAMNLVGYPAGVPRLPLLPATEEEKENLKIMLNKLNILS
ncbi:MAG: 4-hydroxy-tetrahydrodipicolinate synthase [Candidatus Caldatribacteriota bacterium]